MTYCFEPVGVIRSPFREKFGIPRQPSLAASARSRLELLPPYDHPDTVRGLAAFSHVWIQFVFHDTAQRGWTPLVRPPRLGGNARIGVFASRATHRPNPIGLSLVELLEIDTRGGVALILGGADLMDGTPVLDIKPYISFVESRPEARCGFVDGPPPCLTVTWSEHAKRQAAELGLTPDEETLIGEVLAQDPRPAYQDDPERVYGVTLFHYNIRFRIADNTVQVIEILHATQN